MNQFEPGSKQAQNLARFQEIAKRGIQDRLDPDKKARFDEAVKRGLVTLPNQQPPEPPPEQPKESGSFLNDAKNFGLELMAGANRGVTETLDFLGPDQINAVSQIAGSDFRVPTLTKALAPATQGNFMEPGLARDATRAAGEILAPGAAATIPVRGRNVASFGGAVAETVGAGTASVTQPVVQAASTAVDTVQQALPSKSREAAKLPLIRQSGDVAAAGYKLNDAGKVVSDKAQKKALSVGIDEGVVATIASSNKSTKNRIREMIETIEGGKNNLVERSFKRPANAVGDALNDRFKIITNANKQAAKQLDGAAEALKGQRIDVAPPINQFLDDLSKEGISFDPNTGALNFEDSIIQGLDGPQAIIKNVVRRLYLSKNPTVNAYRVHIAKKFIDEQVSYGKSQSGLSGRMENIIKGLRRNLDQTLDQNFPEYDRVNTIYKETRDVIDEVQSLAGQKVDLSSNTASSSLGKLSRKVLSNYANGERVDTLLDSLDAVAARYSTPLAGAPDDELRKLIAVESELRRMFKTAAPANSFQGEIGAEVSRGVVDLASGNSSGVILNALKSTSKKLFGKSEEDKLQALKELLSE